MVYPKEIQKYIKKSGFMFHESKGNTKMYTDIAMPISSEIVFKFSSDKATLKNVRLLLNYLHKKGELK